MKVSEFDLFSIDVWVTISKGGKFEVWDQCIACVFPIEDGKFEGSLFHEPWMDNDPFYSPSQQPDVAKEIALKAGITSHTVGNMWFSESPDKLIQQAGETEAIASMRCLVEMKFGPDFNPEMPDSAWAEGELSGDEDSFEGGSWYIVSSYDGSSLAGPYDTEEEADADIKEVAELAGGVTYFHEVQSTLIVPVL